MPPSLRIRFPSLVCLSLLGGGSTPQPYGFDNGGDRFYATYATGFASRWWGNVWTTIGGTVSRSFWSGHVYTGTTLPPTEQAFYGDFGVAPKHGQEGIEQRRR